MAEKKAMTVKGEKSLAKTEKEKAVAVKEQSQVQAAPKADEKAIQVPAKTEATAVAGKAAASKPEAARTETPTAEAKAEGKKEADPTKEFVDGIMAEMALKGATKKRLIKTLVERHGMDRQKVTFRLKRALITERYAAAHEAAGGAGH